VHSLSTPHLPFRNQESQMQVPCALLRVALKIVLLFRHNFLYYTVSSLRLTMVFPSFFTLSEISNRSLLGLRQVERHTREEGRFYRKQSTILKNVKIRQKSISETNFTNYASKRS
jgi:hypothetical protein